MSEAAPVGRYERTLGASRERLLENALDWAHLPYQHAADFSAIRLIDEDATGWRAEAVLADTRAALLDLRLDRAAGRWVTTTSAGGRLLSRIESDAQALGPDRCRVSVAFFVFGLPASRHDAAGRYYETLYARLYDEDEAMMIARAAALRAGPAALKERRSANLADGREVLIARVCPHWGLPLDAEPDADGIVTCPWHGYRFDAVTGRNIDGKPCGWSI